MTADTPRYEPPTITRNSAGSMNTVGRRGSLTSTTQIDGVDVARLLNEYGSPLFVFSEAKIRQNTRHARAALDRFLPNAQLCWSYKTNYLGAVCAIFHREGSLAEVVSGMEYERARLLGVPGHEIVFNGPAKSEEELRRAIQEEAIVHADHFEELRIVSRVAGELGRRPRVGIRVAVDAGVVPRWDRFGFSLESGAAAEAVRTIVNDPNLELGGLHTHIGTYILDVAAYGRTATKMADFARFIEAEHGRAVEHLDFGGGFPSNNHLSSQYHSGELVPGVQEYIRELGRALGDQGASHYPVLLETGRALVDDSGTLLTTVLANKRLPTGRAALVIDAGINLLFTSWWYQLELTPARPVEGFLEDTTVYGPLCMNIDCVRESIALPPMSPGDQLAIHPVGAYAFTQSMQFIHLRPACVLVSESGEPELVRRREVLQDLVGPEMVPERLLARTPHTSILSTSSLTDACRLSDAG